MATYTETINIVVNDADVMAANTALNTLKSSINNLNNRHIRIQGADSLKSMVSTYKSLLNTIGKQSNMSGVNNVLKQFTRLQSKMGKGIEIKVHEGNLKSAVTSINKLTAEMQELRSVAKSVDLSSIGKNTGSTGRINSQLEQINTTLKQIKSNSKIDIKITQSGVNVNGIQQSITGVQRNARGMQRSASGVNGHNHTGNYFGFYADDSPLYQYGSALKQTTRRMQMASEKINLIGTNLAMFASYAGVKEMTDIMIETPAKAEVQKYLLSEMQGDTVTHDVKNVTGKGVGAEATLYEQLDKMTDKLPISMQNVVQPLYAWNAANGNEPDDLSRAISSMSNFGAQVLNMTGSEERAQTAMEKLSYAFNGQFQAVDQFGISEKSMEKHGFKKEWQGDVEHVEDFWNAVDEITGDATKSMHNFNGMKATVSKDFSRSGKKVWNNFLGPLATTGLSAFHEFDSVFGGIPTQLIAVGSAGLSMATSLTMLIGSAGTAVGAFSEATASFRVMRKNGGGLKEFFKVFSASSFNELNRYGYGGNYGKLHNTGSAAMTGAMMYGGGGGTNVPVDVDGTPLPTVADPKKVGAKAEHKAYMRDINKQRKAELDAIKKSTTTRMGEFRQSLKTNRKYDKLIKDHAKSLKLTTSRMDGLRGAFNSIGTVGKIGIALAGAYVGYKLIQGIWADAYNRNERVKNATDRMNTAWSNLTSKISGGIGNILGDALYNGETKGSDTFDKAIGDIATNTAKILEIVGGDTPAQQQEEAKPDAEEFGWTVGDTDAIKQTKQEAIESARWWGNLKMGSAHFFDQIFGTHKEAEHKANMQAQIDRIKAGDFSMDYGWNSAHQSDRWYNEMFRHEFEMTGVDWRTTAGMKSDYQRYLREKVLGIPDENVIEPVTTEDWLQFNREWSNGKDWENPFTHQSYNDKLMEQYDKKRGERANEPSYDDILYQQRANTIAKRNAESNAQGNQVIQTNSVELQGQSGSGGGSILSIMGQALGKSGIGAMLMGNLGTSSAANTTQAGATPAQTGATPAQTSATPQNVSLDSLYAGIQTDMQSKMPEISNMFNMSLSQSLSTADFSLVGQQVSTNLSNSIQTSFNTTPLDLSGFFSNITSQLSSHSGEFNTSGNEGGTQYKSGFGTGIDGTSGVASAEASSILSALDISSEAYAKGKAAGEAYARGYKEGSDVNSPGLAARTARQEGQYILGFMKDAINPIYYTAREMGSSMASGFARDSSLGYNGVSFGNVQQQNTAGYIMSNASGGGNVNHNTLNFNIAKIDSRERAKEVAEFATQMLKWNNETAGRTTEV